MAADPGSSSDDGEMDILTYAEQFLKDTAGGSAQLRQPSSLPPADALLVIRSPRGRCLSCHTALFSCTPWQHETRMQLMRGPGEAVYVRSCETGEYWDGSWFVTTPKPLVLRGDTSLRPGAAVTVEASHGRFANLQHDDSTVLGSAPTSFVLGEFAHAVLPRNLLSPPWLLSPKVLVSVAAEDEDTVVRSLVDALLGIGEIPTPQSPQLSAVARRLHASVADLDALRRFARERSRPERCATSQGLALLVHRLLDSTEEAISALYDSGSLSKLIAATSPLLRVAAEWARFANSCGEKGASLLDGITDLAALEVASAGVLRQLNAWLLWGEESPAARRVAGSAAVDLDLPFFLRAHRTLMTCPGSLPHEASQPSPPVLVFMGAVSDAYLNSLQQVHQANVQAKLAALKKALPSHLLLLKRLMLMGRGDVFSDLLDSAGPDLALPASRLTLARIRTHFAMCLKRHGVDDMGLVSCELAESTLYDEVTSILNTSSATMATSKQQQDAHLPSWDSHLASVDTLRLVFKPERGPLDAVLSPLVLRKYSLLFRHLFRLKHAQARLHMAWLSTKARQLHLLAHCLQTFAHYISFEVLEPRWSGFIQRVNEANSVEQVAQAHAQMLDACLRECLLTFPRLVSSLNAVLVRCAELCSDVEQGRPLSAAAHNDVQDFLAALVDEGDVALTILAKRIDWDGFYNAKRR